MKSSSHVFLCVFSFLGACAHQPTAREIHSQCRVEMAAARTAVQMREQGKHQQDLLRVLPPLYPDSSHLLHTMYQVADETYAAGELNEIVYGIYRYELCLRELRHQAIPPAFDAVSSGLQTCQSRFDKYDTKQLVACVRALFPATASPPLANEYDSQSQVSEPLAGNR